MKERQVVHGSGSEPTEINREAVGLTVRIDEDFEGIRL